MATDVVPPERVRDVTAAYSSWVGGDLPYERAEVLARYGWTGETVAQVSTLGRDALDRGTAVALGDLLGMSDRWALRVVCDRLRREAAVMGGLGLPLPRVLGWLAVLAGCPTKEALAGLTLLNLVDGERARVASVARVGWFAAWESAAGGLAPLAYAAGLTVEEVGTRRAVGTLDPDGLRALAALRGYRLLGGFAVVERS